MDANQRAQDNINKRIRQNPYPGRGIVIGRNQSGSQYVQIYWVMGRSSASQDRILVVDDDLVKTTPYMHEHQDQENLTIYTALHQKSDLHQKSRVCTKSAT